MKTNKLNVAAALRAAAARPSLESEGTVVTDNAAPETGEVTAETDLEAVKATTVEVGERSDLEAAETELKGADAHHDGTETAVEDSVFEHIVSQEGLSTETKAKIRRFFGSPLVTGKLYEKVEKLDDEIRQLEEKISAVKNYKHDADSVSLEGAKWEGVKADFKASFGFMPDPKRPGKTKWSFFGSPMRLNAAKAKQIEELENKKAELLEELESMLADNKDKESVSQESLILVGALAGGAALLGGMGWIAGKQKRKCHELNIEIQSLEKKIVEAQKKLSDATDRAIAEAIKKGALSKVESDGTESIAIVEDNEHVQKLKNADANYRRDYTEKGTAIVGALLGAGATALAGPIGLASAIAGGAIGMGANAVLIAQLRDELKEKRKELSAAEKDLLEGLANASKASATKVSNESEGSDEAQAAGEAAAQAAANVALGAQAAAEAAAAAVIAADAEVIGEPVEEAAAIVETEAASEETEAEIAADVEHVEEYEKEAVALEALIEAARDARDAGGFSRGEARLFQIGFESIGTRLTGQPFLAEDGGSAVPSLESFGGTMSRRDATTISLENAESWLAKIIRVIKETWNKVWGAVKKFLSQVFDLVERYKARAEKVKKAALDGRTQKADGTVKFGSAAKIAIGGKVDVSGVDKLIQLASVGEKLAELTPAAQVSLNEILYAVGHDVSKAGAEVGSYYDSQATAIKNVFTSGGAFSDMGDVRVADGLPGNMKFSVKVDGDDVGAVVADAGEAGEIGEARALSGQETAQLMDKVIKTLDEVAKAKSALAKVKDDIVTSINADGGNVAQKADGAVVRMVGRLIMTSTRSVSKILSYCVKTSGGYIDYGVASVKAAGAGQAARQQAAAA